jgi:predicted GIY-YIG superfamily endonuclease
MEKELYLYVLKMEKEKEDIKYYTGTSYNVEQRIEEHKKG